MAQNFIQQIKIKMDQLKVQINKLVEQVKAWPQYKQIAFGLMALGILLIIIGILLY